MFVNPCFRLCPKWPCQMLNVSGSLGKTETVIFKHDKNIYRKKKIGTVKGEKRGKENS